MNEDIIPISYLEGTGGNFLCHFIINAKRKDNFHPTLSKYGNAHTDSYKDLCGAPEGVNDQDLEKINHLINQKPSPNVTKPYYTIGHFKDVGIVSRNFKKPIRITIDEDDIDDLSCVFVGKYCIDSEGEPNNLLKNNTLKVRSKFMYKKKYMYFQKEDYSNVLFVSWKELFLGDMDLLINKLSAYTEIDSIYFVKKMLISWREKTQYCIDTFKNTLKDIKI